MIVPAPIDPFLSELKHAQLAGQRVLAAQRRPSTAAGHGGRGEPNPRSGQVAARVRLSTTATTGDRAE